MGFVPRGRRRGLQFVTTDISWEHGTGQRIEGPALAVIMALLGRASAAPLLQGDGVPALLARR